MKIESTKDLKKLIQLCRTMGVEAIEVDGVKMNLGPTPVIVSKTRYKAQPETQVSNTTLAPGGITEDIRIPTNGLTDEQLLFYSAQDHTTQDEQKNPFKSQ